MLRRPSSSASRMTLAFATATALIIALTSCGTPEPAPTTPRPSRTPTPGASPPASTGSPGYVADGTALDNLPLFAAVTAQVWGTEQRASGRAYIDALVAAGFDRSAMQVTPDVTTVGNPVESLQFSVRWGDSDCLVGQVGPSTGEPVTAVLPQLAEGRCLVGNTRPIDW